MMKKLFAILLSLCLLCGVALADETVTEINWEDVAENAANIEGEFKQVADLNLAMFVPAAFSALEVSEEQSAQGVIAILATEDLSATCSIAYQDLGDMDLDAFEEEVKKVGAEEIEYALVNGFASMSYDLTIDGVKTGNAVFAVDNNCVLTFSFGPMTNDVCAEYATIMIASLQAME